MSNIQQMRIDDQLRTLDLTSHPNFDEILLANATWDEIDKIRLEIDDLL